MAETRNNPETRETDLEEEREWIDSLDYVIKHGGEERVRDLLRALQRRAAEFGISLPYTANTPYVNTITSPGPAALPGAARDRAAHQEHHPLERDGHGRAREPRRVGHRRTHLDLRLGGDAVRGRVQPLLPRARTIRAAATRSTSRAMRAPGSTPARSWRAGSRAEQLENFRRELRPGAACRPIPHPRLMPELLGVPHRVDGARADHGDLPGALQPLPGGPRAAASARARCGRSSATARRTSRRRLGAITLASREKLDNLIFVINCNLQRLDGPVRGNGKIIQELEADLPRRRLERDQGHLGRRVGPAPGPGRGRLARPADGRGRRRRLPEVQRQARQLHPRALLRRTTRSCWRWSRSSPTRSCTSCAAAATIRRRCTPPTRPPSSTAVRRR